MTFLQFIAPAILAAAAAAVVIITLWFGIRLWSRCRPRCWYNQGSSGRESRPDLRRKKQDPTDIYDHELGEWVPRERY